MKIFLHIGTHKTGSTSIQYFLWKNRENLRQKYSLLYPKTGKPIEGHAFGHHEIPSSLIKGLYDDNNEKNLQLLISQLQKEIINFRPNIDNLLLSSELFSRLNNNALNILKKYITPLEIIVYFRRQDLYLESLYIQTVKSLDTKLKDFFENFSQKQISKVLYSILFSRWQGAFPEAKIIPRIYDRNLFPEGNVILDFLSILGIDMPEAREQRIESNPSLSHLSALVMRKINERFDLTVEEHRKIIRYLLKLDSEEGSPLKTFFTLPERIEFLESFRESNEIFFNEWFGTYNQFVLSEDEIRFYEEQDRIPKEEIEKMVEDRYRKVLAYMMEENVSPKTKPLPKFKIEYFPAEEVEVVKIDVLQADLLRDGRLTVGGLVLLKKEIDGDYNLKVKDAEGLKEVKWGLTSPGLVSKHPDNPKAKNARFKIEGIMTGGIMVSNQKETIILLKKNKSIEQKLISLKTL